MEAPQQYCFLWIDHWSTCMSKSEWSGWSQAVGTVLAILAAIWIAQWQVSRDRRMKEAMAIRKVLNFANLMSGTCIEIRRKSSFSLVELDFIRGTLEEWIQDARSIDLQLLNQDFANALFQMRSAAVQIRGLLVDVERKFCNFDKSHALFLKNMAEFKREVGFCERYVDIAYDILKRACKK